MQKRIIGYTTGVYDMFHIGHLNVLKRAKEKCDYLIVGVSTDDVVMQSKNKMPIIRFEDRAAIIQAIKYVDEVVPQLSYSVDEKIKAMINLEADILFVGSDWQGTEKWNTIEKELKAIGKSVVYLPHTDGISSTQLEEIIKNGH